MDDSRTVSILLSTFSGLGLPSTLCIPVDESASISSACAVISSRLPPTIQKSRYFITTTSNRQLCPSSNSPISTLLAPFSPSTAGDAVSELPNDPRAGSVSSPSILPLRLTVPLCGGKGGFGSQLRAAGGRMSSRKKRGQDGNPHASSRNLDGRRLRTVAEAKALAEYLAVKPEMDRKEKEARRKRWEQVVEQAEAREEQLRSGKKGRVDGAWVESKEEIGERTREAVKRAMEGLAEEMKGENPEGDDEDEDGEGGDSEMDEEEDGDEAGPSSAGTTPPETGTLNGKGKALSCFGFGDEDDEFMSEYGSEEEVEVRTGKGKAKAKT